MHEETQHNKPIQQKTIPN